LPEIPVIIPTWFGKVNSLKNPGPWFKGSRVPSLGGILLFFGLVWEWGKKFLAKESIRITVTDSISTLLFISVGHNYWIDFTDKI